MRNLCVDHGTGPLAMAVGALFLSRAAFAQGEAGQASTSPAAPEPSPRALAAEPSLQFSATASAEQPGDSAVAADDSTGSRPSGSAETDLGFETGLRVGFGVPVGGAGESGSGAERDLGDLTPWRAPLWIDVGYRVVPSTTLGAYFQVGVGGSGDACTGECDWSDLRAGVQAQFRLASAQAKLKPWLGVGVGYESLSFRTLAFVPVADPETGELVEVAVRTAERLAGPELLLQLGLDFRVEDSLDIGPYLSATLAQYLTDAFKCRPSISCVEDDSIEGSGFHSWLGVGVRGSYLP